LAEEQDLDFCIRLKNCQISLQVDGWTNIILLYALCQVRVLYSAEMYRDCEWQIEMFGKEVAVAYMKVYQEVYVAQEN
jgi:hypothetical protein